MEPERSRRIETSTGTTVAVVAVGPVSLSGFVSPVDHVPVSQSNVWLVVISAVILVLLLKLLD